MPEAVSVILTATPRGKVISPIVAGQNPLMLPILHPDIPPYDLGHTGDWTGATTPSQFSSIAMFWSNGVTAFVDVVLVGGLPRPYPHPFRTKSMLNTLRFKADCFKVGNRRLSLTKVRAFLIACNRKDERALAFDDLQIVKP